MRTAEQALLLKTQHGPTLQGVRDRLLLCLLLDLGPRSSGAAELKVENFGMSGYVTVIDRGRILWAAWSCRPTCSRRW